MPPSFCMSTAAAQNLVVKREIFVGHSVDRESLGDCLPAVPSIDFLNTVNCFDRFFDAVDQESGPPMLDQLKH